MRIIWPDLHMYILLTGPGWDGREKERVSVIVNIGEIRNN